MIADRPALPASSFDDIAVDLLLFAEREAFGLEALEVMAAKMDPADNPSGAMTIAQTIRDSRRAARTAGELSVMFRALAPYEKAIRAAFERLSGGDANLQQVKVA